MAEKKSTTLEREYTIPLRYKGRAVPRYKKTPKAVKTVKEFLVKHMGIRDRDLNKIKLDMHLNEALWHRGIKNPIHKIKVKAVKEGDIVRVYAVDLPTSIHYKKIRADKNSQIQTEVAKEAAKAKAPAKKEAEPAVDADKDGVADKVEEAEKKEAVKEVAEKEAKEDAKAAKKTTKTKTPAAKAKAEEVAKQ
jgi:large subunit ribosomal protein L31e